MECRNPKKRGHNFFFYVQASFGNQKRNSPKISRRLDDARCMRKCFPGCHRSLQIGCCSVSPGSPILCD
ncbi:Protein of unknown function [Pyronema omphalodes CBS 100304]|uniref:Uncharacterized protein n=1 Tax=Pyronema omphalodes (strain CBS 100304) TaxID=1076935 RepID=U4LWB4_PYROM|nr:Protein of unknown function [Pyronema omphalodes CBS 100304]